jgi:hypothetical protein
MTAAGCPPPLPGQTVMNRLVKSARCSQDWAMRSSVALPLAWLDAQERAPNTALTEMILSQDASRPRRWV